MDMFYFVIVWRPFKAVSFTWRLKVSHYDIKPSSGAKFPTSFPSNSVKIWKTEHMILHLMVWPLSSVLFCYDRLVQLTDKKPEKTTDIGDAATGFPAKWRLRNKRRNSILMTRHYQDLGSASDWLNQISHAARPIRRTTQIWVVTRHQYWISALVSQTSFGGETSGSVAKCRLFSQANRQITRFTNPVPTTLILAQRNWNSWCPGAYE